MGGRYTDQEISHIQQLAEQDQTDKQIAEQLNRSPNAIRNIRHRHRLKQNTKQNIKALQQETQTLEQRITQLRREQQQLQARRNEVAQALQVDEAALRQRLEVSLTRLKDEKPELFAITVQEQIIKLTAQLAGAYIKWLIK